jgi:ElaA protein
VRPAVHWQWSAWQDLTPDVLYAFLRLRSAVFVVEQRCVFADMDGLDPACEHLCGFSADGALCAYLRLVPPGARAQNTPALGRVVVAPAHRGAGQGRAVMLEGMRRCARRWPGDTIHVASQQHLQAFYESLGFHCSGRPYLEDGIPHIDMECAEVPILVSRFSPG